ncbi:unnamed protein product, partial [Iphiclides podalirius]
MEKLREHNTGTAPPGPVAPHTSLTGDKGEQSQGRQYGGHGGDARAYHTRARCATTPARSCGLRQHARPERRPERDWARPPPHPRLPTPPRPLLPAPPPPRPPCAAFRGPTGIDFKAASPAAAPTGPWAEVPS